MTDARRFAPATRRNREPILGLADSGCCPPREVLEVASGTAEHAAFFAVALSRLIAAAPRALL